MEAPSETPRVPPAEGGDLTIWISQGVGNSPFSFPGGRVFFHSSNL